MSIVNEITVPIENELIEFEIHFKDLMRSEVPLLNKVTQFMIKRKGKQMRPMFVFLTAKMLGTVNQSTYDAASLVELLHTATIVHDDVVDDANERRGYFSVNALWKNKIAVLVGDYLLSQILLLTIAKKNTDLLNVIAKAVKEMSEGELLQIEKARHLDITEEVYFEVIRKKTASLISACCETAAISVNSIDQKERMREFGTLVGIAFQIKDDIFDYGSSEKIGKPTGIDIREQKMTLPLIYVLNNSNSLISTELKNILKNKNQSSKFIKRAVKLVIENGGIDYAQQKMKCIIDQALDLLKPISDNESKKALIALLNYTINREK